MAKKKWTAAERAAFAARMAKYRKKKNPAKLEHCVKKVKRKRGVANAYAVCNAAIKRKRRKVNPMKSHGVVLFIQKGGGPKMNFNGDKFTNNGRPKHFPTIKMAEDTARELRKKYPILRGYTFKVRFPGAAPGMGKR